MNGFLDWYISNYGNKWIATYYENLECTNYFSVFDTVILFKRSNELYRENINAMFKVYNDMFKKNVDIDIYEYIESNILSYDDFVDKNDIFIQFLIDNLEYKLCDIKIAIKD